MKIPTDLGLGYSGSVYVEAGQGTLAGVRGHTATIISVTGCSLIQTVPTSSLSELKLNHVIRTLEFFFFVQENFHNYIAKNVMSLEFFVR